MNFRNFITEEVKTFYHGTTKSSAEQILKEGFKIEKVGSRSDPGDFGEGIYVTLNKYVAKYVGDGTILHVVVDLSKFAFIDNPYFSERLKSVTIIVISTYSIISC